MRQTESNVWRVRGVAVAADGVGFSIDWTLERVALVAAATSMLVGVRAAPPEDGRARRQAPPSKHRAHKHLCFFSLNRQVLTFTDVWLMMLQV